METRAPYVLVGSFVLVLVAGLVVAVLWFAQVQFNHQVSYYDIYFQGSVTGLDTGSTVRYNGIPVGRVAEVKLDPQDPTRVRVTVELTGVVNLKSDAVAELQQQGLTGGTYINLSGGSPTAPDLEREAGQRYPVIASRQSGLQQVVNAAPEVLSRLATLADELNDVLNQQNRKALSETLENIRRVSASAASHSDEIDSAITDGAAAMRELKATLDNANAILASFNQLAAPGGEITATLKSVDAASREAGDLAKRMDAVVAENQPQLHDFTRRGFAQIEELVAQSQALVEQLSRIADTIERDPSRLLYGDRREGYRPQ